MLIEVFCKSGCERFFMEDLSTPKECIKCKGLVWWKIDEEPVQAVESWEDEDE